MFIFVTVVSVSIIGYILWGWYEKENAKNPIGFYQAGRNIGATVLSGTYIATSFALANAVFYFLFLGYNIGLSAIWIQVAWCLGFAVLYYFLPTILEESGSNTFHEFISNSFGERTGYFAAIISFLGIGLNFGYEVLVGSTIVNSFWKGETPVIILAVIIAAATVGYCALGGFSAVLHTDAAQWILGSIALLLATLLLRFEISNMSGGLESFTGSNSEKMSIISMSSLAAFGAIPFLSNLFFSLPWQICDMTSWQKLSACDPEKKEYIGRGVIFSGIILLFIPGLVTLLMGVYLNAFSGADESLLGALLNISSSYPIVFLLILLGFVAALISTSDTFLIGSIQALVLDITDRERIETSQEGYRVPKYTVGKAKKLLPFVATGFLAFAVWYWYLRGFSSSGLFNIVYVVYSMQLSLVWVMVFALFDTDWSDKLCTETSGILSITFGALANITLFFMFMFGVWGLAVDAMPLICVPASLIGLFVGYVFS